jgi:hypothetical protein
VQHQEPNLLDAGSRSAEAPSSAPSAELGFAGSSMKSSHSRYSSARPCSASSNFAWMTRVISQVAEHRVVDLADGDQFGGGSGEKDLLGDVEPGAPDVRSTTL